MTKPISLLITAENDSIKATKGLVSSSLPCSINCKTARPIKTAKTIIGITLPFPASSITFFGKNPTKASAKLGTSLASDASGKGIFAPLPIEKLRAKISS